MLALFLVSVSTIIYLIWEERFLLFAKEALVKTSSRNKSLSSLTKHNPLELFSNYYCNRLLSRETSLSEISIACATIDKSYKVSG
jgi:hypothetical protein